MSKFPERLAFAVLFSATLLPISADAGSLGLGRVATPAEIAAWDIDVRPDGQGLPDGRGTAAAGEEIFVELCAACHGDFGEGTGRWPVLAGGHGSLTADRPVKTIGSYWPYLSTVWDYVHRAMPFGDAQSLKDDEVYAITAYLLYLNDVVEDPDFELSRENFLETRLPNEANFSADPRPDFTTTASGSPCMSDCKEAVEITARAQVLDVTPEETAQDAAKAHAADQAGVGQADPALIAAGEKQFKKCAACHQVGDGAKNRVGPHLNDILDRQAASTEGFRYSKAMTASGADGLVWTDETLTAFLAAPKTFIPKTKMSFKGLKSDEDRAAVIAYLRQFAE